MNFTRHTVSMSAVESHLIHDNLRNTFFLKKVNAFNILFCFLIYDASLYGLSLFNFFFKIYVQRSDKSFKVFFSNEINYLFLSILNKSL